MSNYTSTGNSAHHTLTAASEDIVTLNGPYPYLEITNRDTTNDLWVTVNTGVASTEKVLTASAGGDGCYYIGPGGTRVIRDDQPGDVNAGSALAASVVHLYSAGAAAYSVTGLTAN